MQQIVCLSAEPWRTVPTRTQQLMIRLKDAQVLFFEPPGRRWRQPGRQMRPGLTVFTLPPLPEVEPRHALLHRQRWRCLARPILRQMERHRFKEPLLWCTDPEQIHLLELLPHWGVVYDCDRDWFDLPPRWESDLALAADVVFAASPGLADHLSPCNDNIALLPNGVNFPMFTRTPPTARRSCGASPGRCWAMWAPSGRIWISPPPSAPPGPCRTPPSSFWAGGGTTLPPTRWSVCPTCAFWAPAGRWRCPTTWPASTCAWTSSGWTT